MTIPRTFQVSKGPPFYDEEGREIRTTNYLSRYDSTEPLYRILIGPRMQGRSNVVLLLTREETQELASKLGTALIQG